MSAKSQAGGYIFGVREPVTNKYIFVGNSYTPWKSLKRHLKDSSNKEFKFWAKKFQKEHPFIDLLSEEVLSRWELAKSNGLLLDEVKFDEPPIPDGKIRLYWDVLGYEDTDFTYIGTQDIEPERGSAKNFIINKLKAEGHPLFNGSAGRKKRPTISFS